MFHLGVFYAGLFVFVPNDIITQHPKNLQEFLFSRNYQAHDIIRKKCQDVLESNADFANNFAIDLLDEIVQLTVHSCAAKQGSKRRSNGINKG